MLIEKVAAHIAEFSPRLRSNTRALYQYCAIPVVRYPQLDEELFCNIFYLRHLSDTTRFPEWPINEPVSRLQLLQSTAVATHTNTDSFLWSTGEYHGSWLHFTSQIYEDELEKYSILITCKGITLLLAESYETLPISSQIIGGQWIVPKSCAKVLTLIHKSDSTH
jgi:hypothetical protein